MNTERSNNGSRGTSQSGIRHYNQRLALSLIRKAGSLPKAEIARLTGLSAQTASVIVRQLERDGLVVAGSPQRGKVGQPLIPFSLDPEGAFSIGLKVGRRSGSLMLLDLTGAVRKSIHQAYQFPTPQEVVNFISTGVAALIADLSPAQRQKISGLGVAAPFELWNWEQETGAPHAVLEAWRSFDLAAETRRLFEWPVHFCNDATAACAAELLLGKGQNLRDYGYFYVGYFVGGGIVIDGSLYQGRTGNAGAFGSFPIGNRQLIYTASLHALEQDLIRQGIDSSVLWNAAGDWGNVGEALDRWVETAAADLAQACVGAACVIEPAAIVIDGAMPPHVRAKLVARVTAKLVTANLQGVTPFTVVEGSIGVDARAMGAACLPLFANFITDRDMIFKESD